MFSLGSKVWPGLGKVVEETAELNVELGKLMATGGDYHYWEGIDLRETVRDECADALATIHYFIEKNFPLEDKALILERMEAKLQLYSRWAKDEQI